MLYQIETKHRECRRLEKFLDKRLAKMVGALNLSEKKLHIFLALGAEPMQAYEMEEEIKMIRSAINCLTPYLEKVGRLRRLYMKKLRRYWSIQKLKSHLQMEAEKLLEYQIRNNLPQVPCNCIATRGYISSDTAINGPCRFHRHSRLNFNCPHFSNEEREFRLRLSKAQSKGSLIAVSEDIAESIRSTGNQKTEETAELGVEAHVEQITTISDVPAPSSSHSEVPSNVVHSFNDLDLPCLSHDDVAMILDNL